MPAVSFVIATHNRAALLPKAIESGLRAGSDLEVIVVDDGSTDDTRHLCARWPEIRYIALDRNRGAAYARNAGIRASSAEFIAFLDDDDLRLPDSLRPQLQALDHNPAAALCYGQVLVGDAQNGLTGEIIPARCPSGQIFWELLEQNFVPEPSVVARRKILLESGLFNPELPRVHDWDLWLRLAERYPFAAVEQPVAIYRRANPASRQICSNTLASVRQMLGIQQRALSLPLARAAPRSARRGARRRLLDLVYDAMVTEAIQSLKNGDRNEARNRLREALRLRPSRKAASAWLLRSLLPIKPLDTDFEIGVDVRDQAGTY
jgi:glycosyltransferase involved in cell wall biosynthesis